jgi:acetylornithine deacetylase/succinyl-diaminopimelate desuccinylase-like protein
MANTEATTTRAEQVRELMPQLRRELDELVRIPSISGEGQPMEPILEAHDVVARLAREAGFEDVQRIDLPNTNPIVYASIPAPEGAPTVLLYSHYDVVPAGDESAWTSAPFEPVERDGAIYGRGSADTKSNIVAHLGAIRAWGDELPVGVKLLIEGQEEVGGGELYTLPRDRPDLVDADVMVIGDMGSLAPGIPTHTITLRGMANVTVEVSTLDSPKHSGQFGGAAPDALIVLLQALATLHDEHGDVAVEGLLRDPWTGGGASEAEFRELAGILGDLPLQGSGDLGSRVWTGPAITVIGIDAPPVDAAVNAVQAHARATINVRVHPKQDAEEAQAAVIRHLEQLRPFGVPLIVTPGATGNGFAADTSGPAYDAARTAWSSAWDGREVVTAGVGGSIPLVTDLQTAVPRAAVLLVGTTDGYANIHGPDERVLLDEFERAVIAEADFFGLLAARSTGDTPA